MIQKQQLTSIKIFWQKNDTVTLVDYVANKGINYYKVVSNNKRKGVLAHEDMFSTMRVRLIFCEHDAEAGNL